jgi:tRNA threonylcarbamoyladenosine biosynthesis protein TsaE
MGVKKLVSRSARQTQSLGRQMGKQARSGDIYLLTGDLGAGKTCLTQGIAWGLGVKEYAFSPTFVLVKEYTGRLPLYHIDFYRLDHIEEIIDLALDEYLYSGGVCVIEWAEKGIDVLPRENLHVNLSYTSLNERSITLKPTGKRYSQLIDSLKVSGDKWN